MRKTTQDTGPFHIVGEAMIRLMSRLAAPALALPRPAKRALVVVADIVLCVLSVWLAFYLRLGEFYPLAGQPLSLVFSPVLIAALVSVLLAMARAMLLYGVMFAAVFTFYGVQGVPRTVGLIQPLLLLVLVGASRAAARVWLGGLYQNQIKKSAMPQVLIYGAGSAGRQLASATANVTALWPG